MSNNERKQVLQLLINLYSPTDKNVAFAHMPDQAHDVNDEEFADYFDFLQTLYSLRGYYMNLSPQELSKEINALKNMAQTFNYPTNQIEALNAQQS